MKVILLEKKTTKQTQQTNKHTARQPIQFFWSLHLCTTVLKDSPSKTLTTGLIPCSSFRLSFDACCCRPSSTKWFRFSYGSRKNKTKLCCFDEFSVHWTFGPGELSRKDRVCFSPTDQSWGAETSWELRLNKRLPLRGVFYCQRSQTHTHTPRFWDHIK